MVETQQVGGVKLSTFGLRLSRLEGNHDLPKFKDILDEHDYESNLLVLDEQNVKIRLIGFYSSKVVMGQYITNFQNKIRSQLKQQWILTNHYFNKMCVVKNGMQIYFYNTSVEIILTLTITE